MVRVDGVVAFPGWTESQFPPLAVVTLAVNAMGVALLTDIVWFGEGTPPS